MARRFLVVEDLGSGQGRIVEALEGDGEDLFGSPFCAVGGTANALTLTPFNNLARPSAYVAGRQYRFRATTANTGATTINISGLGAKTAVTVTGAALPAGYIRTDVDTTITYDAVGDRFVVGREIERGSNASGTFTRWADGRLTGLTSASAATDISTVSGSIFRSVNIVLTLPAALISVTSAAGYVKTDSPTVFAGGPAMTTTTATAVLYFYQSLASRVCSVAYEGYWY